MDSKAEEQKDFILGVDIGGTKSAAVLAQADGTIVARESEPTRPTQRGPEETLARLAELGRGLMTQARIEAAQVRGVGVSCGGPLDTQAGIIYAPPNLPGWECVPVRQLLSDALGLPVRVENDANATALAEWRLGAGQGAQNVVYMTMGTGVGGGIILEGRLYRGTNDLAGEMGHMTILPNGPVCGCGKRGCLEALASGPSIARLARERRMYARDRRVVELAGGKPEDITAAHVVVAAKEGDAFAQAVLEEAGTYMGIGIANLIQTLNPERVILGTIAVHAGDLVLGPIRRAVAEYAWERSRSVCEIVPAALGDRAQDLAAVVLWME